MFAKVRQNTSTLLTAYHPPIATTARVSGPSLNSTTGKQLITRCLSAVVLGFELELADLPFQARIDAGNTRLIPGLELINLRVSKFGGSGYPLLIRISKVLHRQIVVPKPSWITLGAHTPLRAKHDDHHLLHI